MSSGLLADSIGWRWSFFGQCPLILLGLAMILWKIPNQTTKMDEDEQEVPLSQKMKRVDIAGAVALASMISFFLLAVDFATKEASWFYTLIPSLLALFCTVLFYIIESRWAKEPILPIEIITTRAAATSYIIAGCQLAAQFGLFYCVPIYFQIMGTSVSGAGLRLLPAVIGNATGGIMSGLIISRTGRYKSLTVFASIVAVFGYTIVLLRWTGHTAWLEVLYIFFGGFGTGIIQSTTFIHLAASLEAKEMAIAGTILYLSQNLFLLIGIQLSTATLRYRLRISLNAGLHGIKQKKTVRPVTKSSPSHLAYTLHRSLSLRYLAYKQSGI